MRIVITSEYTLVDAKNQLNKLYKEHKYLEVRVETGTRRTLTQNAALHLWLKWLAETLNDAGLDMRKVLKKEFEIPWTPENCKEFMWKPVQKALTGEGSTADAKTVDYGDIYDLLCRHLGEKFGVECPEWPSRSESV